MVDREYMENAEGVHLMNVGDYSLCGDGSDLGHDEGGGWDMRPTKRRTVTCPRCVEVIIMCRGVRVARAAAGGTP